MVFTLQENCDEYYQCCTAFSTFYSYLAFFTFISSCSKEINLKWRKWLTSCQPTMIYENYSKRKKNDEQNDINNIDDKALPTLAFYARTYLRIKREEILLCQDNLCLIAITLN